ncbi:MAG: Nif11-like leader peptide family natural product precursor [Rhodocyclales bacterium]|nr:Nif11-like leader peptide family natural product precursor [Rhodocyclales bacterium]
MSVAPIKAFSDKAKADPALAEALKACQKIKELRALAKDQGYEIEENSLYPPNEPQFSEEQLSERLAKALLRV